MNPPLVSVIIPVYNGERFLSAALDSVFAQDYRPIEVIVVDDGSTDCTEEIAQGYPEIQYVHQENQGPSAARNTAIASAHGEFIAFLDADDIWLPNKLSTQIGYLLANPQVGYVSARIRNILESNIEWPAQLNREYFLQDPPIFLPSALLIRRIILDQVGLHDPQLSTAEDMDWFVRANHLKVPMAVIDSVLLHRRLHDRNISFNMTAIRKDMFTVLRHSAARNRTSRKE